MRRTEICVYFGILQLLILGVSGQDRLLVDVESDIPQDGTWDIDCDDGYADLSTDFNCGPDGGGTILIPPEELNGEKGFWTACVTYGCKLKYQVQPGDTLFKARVYQSDIETEVSFDGIVWDYIPGKGWIEIEETLLVAGKNQVSLRFSHFSPGMFNILDKIVINGDFDPPTNPTTAATTETTEFSSSTEITSEPTTETTEFSSSTEITTEPSTETTELSSSTEITTEPSTETTEFSSSTEITTEPTTEATTEEDFSSSTESTTTSDDISSTTDLDTTPVTVTTTEDSSSTVSDDPTGSSSEPSTSDGPEGTSPTDDPTSSSTDEPGTSSTGYPSTENDSTTTSEFSSLPTSENTSETTETETTSSVTPPPSPCTDPPCIISSMRPSTTKKPSNFSGFVNGLWGKLLFSAFGIFLFILLSACCLRFVCVRGGVFRRRSKKDDLEDIISQSGSSNANISGKTSSNMNSSEGELYLYMNRYPYLLNPSVQKANHVPNKIQISSVPPPSSTSPSSSSSTNTSWTPRAIYRESTPYMAFGEQNSGKSIETVAVPSSTHVMDYDYVDTSRSNPIKHMSPPHFPRKEAQPVSPNQRNYPETQNHNRSP